ncbi:MAG: DUF4835 family protein [Marinifilaceae bacterium]|jgi:hypothetical protein|nr:DUF4835 family protein [Marinifilaceae bacterium]
MRKKNYILFLLLFCAVSSFAQEFNASVSVTYNKIQSTNNELFNNMRRDIYEFMNNTRWTNNVYTIQEKIRCSFSFTLESQIGADEFKGNLQIQLNRPVFNSSYQTTVLNIFDKDIRFRYAEFESLKYKENSTNSNLVSLLAYYANIMLGYTYDTFSLNGGGVYFSRAEAIVAMCQNNIEVGWKSFEGRRNRYWLIENIQDATSVGVRRCLYMYHRQGLDMMEKDIVTARSSVLDALELLRKSYRERSNSMFIQLFFDAKSEEILNIFSEAYREEKTRVYNVVAEVDPTHNSKYKVLIKN